MYLDFDEYRPDIQPIGRAISWREGILLSIILHLLFVIALLMSPNLFGYHPAPRDAVALAQPEQPATFVFVQPRLDVPSPRPPNRGEVSDRDRMARASRAAVKPENALPFSRGNTPERVESVEQAAARGQGPRPEAAETPPQMPAPPRADPGQEVKAPEAQTALALPPAKPAPPQGGASGRIFAPGGGLGDALRNLQRYVQRDTFENPQGGGGQFGPEIQFDTKGVEFGPWIRRFVAQVKRNWYPMIPYAAMMYKGHVVITFNVHKSGALTDLSVVGPCPIDAFNTAAFGALKASNPTEPLPPEYPDEKAFFTVTFFYNEVPPR